LGEIAKPALNAAPDHPSPSKHSSYSCSGRGSPRKGCPSSSKKTIHDGNFQCLFRAPQELGSEKAAVKKARQDRAAFDERNNDAAKAGEQSGQPIWESFSVTAS